MIAKGVNPHDLYIDTVITMKHILTCAILVLCCKVSASDTISNYRVVFLVDNKEIVGFEEKLFERKREGVAQEKKEGKNSVKTDVRVSDEFWVMNTEVQYDLYDEVYKWAIKNGYFFTNGCSQSSETECTPEDIQNKIKPVTFVSWIDSIIWANALSEKMGLEPVYRNKSGKIIKNEAAGDNKIIERNTTGYRLPSLQEWILLAENSMVRKKVSGKYHLSILKDNSDIRSKWKKVGSYFVIEKKVIGSGVVGIANDVFEWLGSEFSSINEEGNKLFNKMYYFCGVDVAGFNVEKPIYCDIHTRQFRFNDLGFRLVRSK
ncbi:SUMF1/EgtB/PvdO family nonheme iron enzyme [Zooshikella harenae]|uniref:SUMF1/EgtB/PvdO family nonheme iron enzyme n=1 Tax=Zooshikella harenae TaxID=2827238 RepID=A0ABS5ZG84_9GAMM|nr:SUMF1/EgtB/PvdO family nonheme iron enzyme [Zooshikella harenae]MBU2712291.1 SUMF1/EgtB/PvdO family nonheme iron enzyme [Zooshikella harenae]